MSQGVHMENRDWSHLKAVTSLQPLLDFCSLCTTPYRSNTFRTPVLLKFLFLGFNAAFPLLLFSAKRSSRNLTEYNSIPLQTTILVNQRHPDISSNKTLLFITHYVFELLDNRNFPGASKLKLGSAPFQTQQMVWKRS